ncbi:hypothetical protein SIN8267_01346 [Sinobacterium norvegicum]|uniref:Uncharacterized protein n=1 Tax=Sinobacterium norvegicum TaxID=1641715 RepID=A0ABM9ADG9_9GAMM|nr:hypothetical protein [Sinobacterium norvegicum]CAH0991244.1 hypothetical protein SIN8267_01346 [Sinobacterium norvegicum]
MATLIFQLHILQWHKGQRSAAEQAARAATPTRYAIDQQPQYFVLDSACVIDQHGDDTANSIYPNGRIHTAMLKDGSIRLDRFIIRPEQQGPTLYYSDNKHKPIAIGTLNNGWLEAVYHHRYAVEQDNEIFWLYEQVTLNAACVEDYHRDYFLKNTPVLQFQADNQEG